MTRKSSILTLAALAALGTTALPSTDACARGGSTFRGSFHAFNVVHVSPAASRAGNSIRSARQPRSSWSVRYQQATNRMTNKPSPTLTTVAGNPNTGNTSNRFPTSFPPKTWTPNTTTGTGYPPIMTLGGTANGSTSNRFPPRFPPKTWTPSTPTGPGYPPSATRGGTTNGPTTYTGPAATNNDPPRWRPKWWPQPGPRVIVDNGPATNGHPWQPPWPPGRNPVWNNNPGSNQAIAIYTSVSGHPRPFSHPPHNLDQPHCSLVDAQMLYNMVYDSIPSEMGVAVDRRLAASQLVVTIMSVLETMQQLGADPATTQQYTALAVSRAIQDMLTKLATAWYEKAQHVTPTGNLLNDAVDQASNGLSQTIQNIVNTVGQNGCQPGNPAPGASPGSVTNIADIEGKIESDLDGRINPKKDPSLPSKATSWASEAAVILTSALINGTDVCAAFNTLSSRIGNHAGNNGDAMYEIESDLSRLTGQDFSSCG